MSNTPSATTGYNKNMVSIGFEAQTQGRFWTDNRVEYEDSISVRFHAQAKSGNPNCTGARLDDWKLKLNIKENGKWGVEANRKFHMCVWQNPTADTWSRTYPRLEHDYQVPVQMGYGLEPYSTFVWHYTSVEYLDVPAKVRKAPNNPSLTVSKTEPLPKEKITLSWKTNPNNTNMHYKSTSLYIIKEDGVTTSISLGGETGSIELNPTDYITGPVGKFSVYIKSTYLWDNKDNYYQSETKDISVTGGICTIFDEAGNKHQALIHAYDADGKLHTVIPYIYNNNGVLTSLT